MPKDTITLQEDKKVFLKYNTSKNLEKKYLTLNVFLTNELQTQGGSVDDSDCVFQPKMLLKSSNNNKVFLNISRITQIISGENDKAMLFLFRNKKHFAQGKNCSVEWNLDEKDDKTDWIQTTYIPYYKIPEIAPVQSTLETKQALDMKFLSEVTDFKKFKDILMPIVKGYGEWIHGLQNKLQEWEQDSDYNIIKEFTTSQENIPKQNIEQCNHALRRIQNGINRISTDPLIGEAFRFTNEVMFQNLLHVKWAKQNKDKIEKGGKINEDGPNYSQNPEWRLFQIAFLLLNIESIADEDSKDRKTVDLLWFPTGGGKTEALGNLRVVGDF